MQHYRFCKFLVTACISISVRISIFKCDLMLFRINQTCLKLKWEMIEDLTNVYTLTWSYQYNLTPTQSLIFQKEAQFTAYFHN